MKSLWLVLSLLFCSVTSGTGIACIPGTCNGFNCTENLDGCAEKNGIVRKNGGFCGCCDACIIQIGEGGPCPLPIMGAPPNRECAENLSCNTTTNRCVRK